MVSFSTIKAQRTRATGVILAFAAVYLIWGSTYLAIRIAIETIPPFLMAAWRFLIAGGLLFGWSLARGLPRPSRFHWKPAVVVGGLMLLGGNGGVVWAEQTVPSGTAALLVATVPLWMVLMDWLRPGGRRPRRRVFLGLGLGLLGIVLLVGPGDIIRAAPAGDQVPLAGMGAVLLGALLWSAGSIYSRSARLPESSLVATAMEMLAGGALLLLLGSLTGEWAELDLAQLTGRSLLALAYLVFFGSIIAFSAYIWLLKETTPARVSTYAYVNPVVAVFLGWALAGEELTAQVLLAAAVIITAVVLITMNRRH